MTAQSAFVSAALAAGLAITPLHVIDPTLAHEDGEPTALVAQGNDGLVYGGFNPHEPAAPWFLAGVGLDLSRSDDADALYARLI